MTDTARWSLPLLEAGQAQKEMTHNEALATLDLLVQASVVAVGPNAPPASPAAGQCWAVGAAPTGAWAGHAHALAGWTAGGWRFAAPGEGASVWSAADGCSAIWTCGQWRVGQVAGAALLIGGVQVIGAQRPAIAEPAAGTTVDAEARTTLAEVLGVLRAHGLIAS